MNDPMNELIDGTGHTTDYRPWESLGIDELSYWKQQFLSKSKEAYLAANALRRVANWENHRCATLGCETGCPWDNAAAIIDMNRDGEA